MRRGAFAEVTFSSHVRDYRKDHTGEAYFLCEVVYWTYWPTTPKSLWPNSRRVTLRISFVDLESP
jgi:hypothetical protein